MTTSFPSAFEHEHLELRRRLGAGSFGVVYEAVDKDTGERLALKTLNHASADALARFKQEFRALAGIVHPNLVTLYRLHSIDDKRFFTMQFVDGVDFVSWVRHSEPAPAIPTPTPDPTGPRTNQVASTSPATIDITGRQRRQRASAPPAQIEAAPPQVSRMCDEHRLRRALVGLVRGVQALHDHGKLHRDIKPSNVLVTPEGQTVILDFGLVIDLQRQQRGERTVLAGTPAYMSPEQAAGQPMNEASDWYSIGCMLFEAITGQLPFQGDMSAMLQARQTTDGPSPSQRTPDVPEDLDALCANLLKLRPENRLDGADILAMVTVSTDSQQIRAADVGARTSQLESGLQPFVGRQSELDALCDAFQVTHRGHGTVALIYGVSGMGKTTLVHRFLGELRRREPTLLVLSGRVYQQVSVPYKALDEIVDVLSKQLRNMSNADVEGVLPRHILDLATLFPVLMDVDAVRSSERRTVKHVPPEELHRRGVAAFRELFARLAERTPVIVIVDDLQWTDAESIVLLQELMRPPDPPKIMLVLTWRTEELLRSPFIAQLRHGLSELRHGIIDVREFPLQPLAVDESRDLAGKLMEPALHDDAHIEQIALESEGIPFFIGELIKFIDVQPTTDDRAVPSLDEVVLQRVRTLPSGHRHLLELLALAARPLPVKTAMLAAGITRESNATLAALRVARLVKVTGHDDKAYVEPYHGRVTDAVASSVRGAYRRDCHIALSEALEQQSNVDHEFLAEQLRGAGRVKQAVACALAAAERAENQLAFDRAARLLQSCLDMQTELGVENTRQLRRRLADTLSKSGHCEQAGALFLSLANEPEHADEQFESLRRGTFEYMRSADFEVVYPLLGQLLNSVGVRAPRRDRRVQLLVLWEVVRLRIRGLEFTPTAEADVDPTLLQRFDVCFDLGRPLYLVDITRGLGVLAILPRLALELGEPERIAAALLLHSIVVGAVKGRSAILPLLHVARTAAEYIDDPERRVLSEGRLAMYDGLGHWFDDDYMQARPCFERAFASFANVPHLCAWEQSLMAAAYGITLLWSGCWTEQANWLPNIVAHAERLGDFNTAATLMLTQGMFPWLMRDVLEPAEQLLNEYLARWSRREFYIQHAYETMNRSIFLLYQGRAAETLTLIEERWTRLQRFFMVRFYRTYFYNIRILALLEMSVQQPAHRTKYLRRARRDIRKLANIGGTLPTAHALLLRGCLCTARGHLTKGIRLLEQSEVLYRRGGLQLYVDCSQVTRGTWIGGKRGDRIRAQAIARLRSDGIVRPERIANVWAPDTRPGQKRPLRLDATSH